MEGLRGLRLSQLLLRRRAHAVGDRIPVVIVPGFLGTRLRDARGRALWGTTRGLYFGASAATASEVLTDGLLTGLTVVPGLYEYDVFGGLLRYLGGVGGYRAGEDLHVLDYDWRAGAIDAAEKLAALVDRLRGAGDERVDLVCNSTGGQIARVYLAEGGARCVRRVVYVGTPQRGTFDAVACLHRGFRFAPLGKNFTGAEAARTQTPFDCLPHPDERVFVDAQGRPLDIDLYDASTWTRLGLLPPGAPDLAPRLARARALYERLDRAETPAVESFVIGARHLPTPAHAVVKDGRAYLPPPSPRRNDPFARFTYQPGDGELCESSLRALPGLDERRLWFARPAAHHRLPSDPEVHRLTLEALLATGRRIPTTSLERLVDAAPC